MRFIYRLQIVTLAMLLFQGCSNSAVNDERLNRYDVVHYNLSINFNTSKKNFRGSVVVKAIAREPLRQFVLSASTENLTIDSTTYNGQSSTFEHQSGHLIIELPSEIQPSKEISLTVYYHGFSTFTGEYEGGGVCFSTDEGKDCFATASEPMFARTWWPCKDMPSDKATISVSVTVPSNLTAVSNGILQRTLQHDGQTTYAWETKYPIATYLVSIAAAEYATFSDTYRALNGKEMLIQYYVFPEDSNKAVIDFQNTSKILTFFATTFCEYPFVDEKFGYAEVPGDLTMENQTICSIQEELITGKRTAEMTLVHETAHQWWGDLITTQNWQHTWLNEGFATYAEALYIEHTKGRDGYNNYIKRVMGIGEGQLSGSVIGHTEESFWDSFSSRVYFKGALVLHMLRSMVGDSEFFAIMRNYLNNPRLRYQSARTEDFIAECENVHKQNLKWFFDQWVYATTDSMDRPQLEYQWTSMPSGSSYDVSVSLTQKNAPSMLYRLPMSIDIMHEQTAYSFSIVDSLATQSFTFTVPEEPTSIIIDNNNTIFKLLKRKE